MMVDLRWCHACEDPASLQEKDAMSRAELLAHGRASIVSNTQAQEMRNLLRTRNRKQ